MAGEITTPSGRLTHHSEPGVGYGQTQNQVAGAQTPRIRPVVESSSPATRRPALALTAEGPRRADLIAWAGAHRETLRNLRLFAPAGIGALLREHVDLGTEPLRSGTVGPAATAGLAAAGELDGMIAFTDPIELRPGDTTTRSLARLAVFWDIPIAGNRATADLLLATITGPARPGATPASPTAAAFAEGGEPARGAVKLWNIRATLDDVPGRLAVLTASLARRAINILSVQVHLTPDGPIDELLVAASPILVAADLASAVVDGGARAPRVTPADAHALVDGPTRALSLATRLLRSPDELAAVLGSLLPGTQLVWRAEEPADHSDRPAQLWLADPAGGGYLLSRPEAPFTPAERARAYAMIDVAVLAQARPQPQPAPESWQVVLADGKELTVRRATPEDLDRVIELHQRCSMTTRLRRYLSSTRVPSPTTLARLLSPASGPALVVEDDAGHLIGMANLSWPSGANADEGGAPELSLLLEDAWQQRRLGTFLARRLAAIAAELGVVRLKAVVHASNAPMVRIMSALCQAPGRRLHREYDGGMLTLIVSMRSDAPAPVRVLG